MLCLYSNMGPWCQIITDLECSTLELILSCQFGFELENCPNSSSEPISDPLPLTPFSRHSLQHIHATTKWSLSSGDLSFCSSIAYRWQTTAACMRSYYLQSAWVRLVGSLHHLEIINGCHLECACVHTYMSEVAMDIKVHLYCLIN